MSGGVDSSTVAAMLCQQGYNVVGLTLQLWNQRRLAGKTACRSRCRGAAARSTTSTTRAAWPRRSAFRITSSIRRSASSDDVVRPFVAEYLSGRTPIPCSLCNNHLKFDQLLITARQIGADLLATGHYARNEFDETSGRWLLKRPADRSKDQTYFLFGLTQEQLSRTRFPLGEMHKPDVREEARRAGSAPVREARLAGDLLHSRRRLQAVSRCLSRGAGRGRFPIRAGELVTTTGEVVGQHSGIHNFTVGQRKGLGVATGSPLYVLEIRGEKHRWWSAAGDELFSPTLTREAAELDCRRRSARADAGAGQDSPSPRACGRDRWRRAATMRSVLTFDEPQRAITPGQAVVFYEGDVVVGGGWMV